MTGRIKAWDMYQLHHFESFWHIFNCLLLLLIQKDIFCCPSVCQQCTGRQADCRNSDLSFIPNNFAQNTIFLYLSGNNISCIHPNSLIGLQQLVVLHLDNSSISHVYPKTFVEFKKLWLLHLNNNYIKYLAPGTFEGLSNLHSLYLQNNEIVFVPKGLFSGLTSVQYLMLQRNCLSNLGSGIFFGMINLQILNLANNKISKISNTAFHHLDNLTCLYFEGNNLTYVPSNAFAALHNLQRLSLSVNPIRSIHPFAFKGLSRLEYLSLKSANINTIHANGFSGLINLKKLVLSNNNLVNINSHTFSRLDHLMFLHLDRNKIINIADNTFERMGSLKILCLAFNNLTFLEPAVLKPLVSLTHLQANFNPWNCSCKLQGLISLLASSSISAKMHCQNPSSLRGKYMDYVNLNLFANCFNTTTRPEIFKNIKSSGIHQRITTLLMTQSKPSRVNTNKEHLNFNAFTMMSSAKISPTSAHQYNYKGNSRNPQQEASLLTLQLSTQNIPVNLTPDENEATSTSFKTSLICIQQVEKLNQAFDILLIFFILACAVIFFLICKIIQFRQKSKVQKNSDRIEYYGFYQAGSYNVTVPQNPVGNSRLDCIQLSKPIELESQAQVILFEHSAL